MTLNGVIAVILRYFTEFGSFHFCIKVGSMGVGAVLYMYDVIVEKFTFAMSSSDEFLFSTYRYRHLIARRLLGLLMFIFVGLKIKKAPIYLLFSNLA